MIKGSTDNGDYLVQVSAQVMTRDDSTGGWVPVGGGGLSRVRLCKLSPPEGSSAGVSGGGGSNSGGPMGLPGDQASDTAYRIKPEYVIHGVRISDSAEGTLKAPSRRTGLAKSPLRSTFTLV
ncbi:sprouty-related, EVH1 domain-containing protein 2 [Elysia marginata]|uniref:Sprouty-related, EVH1 domain-containing protein 2 n=1 Tax=Elysia marginata TaxID=1093978 RepID=A0AAV4F3G3_9GAST|nr:sprouty-related, EVH1 domain-containing protein 2 [Elysia marginata]